MPPKNPQPGHPLADAAAAEAAEIVALANASAAVPPVEVPPVDAPLPASVPTDDTPAPRAVPDVPADDQDPDVPPLDPRYVQRIVQQNDTLLGRLEAESRGRREAEEAAKAALANREFLEKRAQELAEANRKAEEELAKLRVEKDVTEVVSSFKSENVDPQAFGDIYRGLAPHLQRLEASVQSRIDQAVEKRVGAFKQEAEEREVKLRKELNEQTILREVPAFGKLLDRPDFKDFLAEHVPGTRTTRRAEVLGAWRDGDTRFIADVVAEFTKRAPARADDAEPANHGRPAPDQSPRLPRPEPTVDEETLSAAFQQMNEGKITVAHFRKLKALKEKQELEAWRRSKRTH